MDPQELIRAARQLAVGQNNPGQPTDAELRRAVSTAYYALFHALASCCADLLVGSDISLEGHRLHALWIQTYRALDHGVAKRRCKKNFMGTFPTAIQDFANQFANMQERRHDADYNPDVSFARGQVLKLIDETETRITNFQNAPEDDRRTFAFYVMFDFNVT